MLLVTGGAGFIGSNVVAALNDAGRADVAVCDTLGHDGKWRNLAKRQLVDIVPPAELLDWLKGRKLDAIIHLGAISETTATDGDLVVETNFRLSMRLLDWCTANAIPLIYAFALVFVVLYLQVRRPQAHDPRAVGRLMGYIGHRLVSGHSVAAVVTHLPQVPEIVVGVEPVVVEGGRAGAVGDGVEVVGLTVVRWLLA